MSEGERRRGRRANSSSTHCSWILARKLDGIGTWNAARFMAGINLLSHKWFSGCYEDDLARKPSIIHENCQKYGHVQFSITTPAIKVFPRPVGSATRVFSKRQCFTMLHW